jgi:hypothetical protein
MVEDVLRAKVIAAFAGIPKPAVIAPHPCPECDELAEDFAGFSGETLSDAVFDNHVWDLPLLSDEAKHYYLSAWLLRAVPNDGWNDACDSLVYALEADHRWSPNPPYTEAQWVAIDAVLEKAAQCVDPVTVENVEKARRCLPR